jgi:hypothetical protein
MGQPIAVTRKTTSRPALVRFEINRTLTGMGHERYASIDDVLGDRPSDLLARRLFESGKVAHVHLYANIIDVTLASGASPDGLEEAIRDLYIHYKEGVQVSFQE